MNSRLAAVAAVAALTLAAAPATAATDATCVSLHEGQRTDDGETRRHAERRYGTRADPYRGRFELWSNHHRRYWRSYEKCGGPAGVRLWVQYRDDGPDVVPLPLPGDVRGDRVTAWTWLYLPPEVSS